MGFDGIGEAVNKGVEDVFGVLNAGLTVFKKSAEEVQALKILYADASKTLSSPAQIEAPPMAESPIVKFLKSESGLLTVGAMAVLAVGFVFTRGR